MPGPAFTGGERVSLHPIEEEDHEFIQRGRNDPSTRVTLGDTTIRRREDVAELFEDGAEYHFLVCVGEQSESTGHANGEGYSPSSRSSGRGPREDGEAVSDAIPGDDEDSAADDVEAASDAETDDEPEPVGVVAFGWVRDDVRIGSLMYWIAPEHRGNGYVTEGTALLLDYAFGERGFNKVNANAIASNEASIRTLESLGFEREGRQRRECFVNGEWEDMFSYGLLAEEWLDGSGS